MMNSIFSSPAASAIVLTLLHFIWQGLLVVAGYWGLQQVVNIRTSQGRYAISLAAFAVMAITPLLTFIVVYQSTISQLQDSLVQSNRLHDVAMIASSSGNDSESKSSLQQIKIIDDKGEGNSIVSVLNTLEPSILFLWLAGVMLSGARLLAGMTNVFWLRQGRIAVDARLRQRSSQIGYQLGIKKLRLFASTRIREAAVVGFWKPVVLLPVSWLTELPADVLEAVIAHELAHIRRYDVWVNLFQRVVEMLLYYHPAVWWLSSRIRLEREMCCDELAIEATGEPGNYVRALEQVGRLQVRGTLNLTTPFTGDRKMNLLSRVKNVLKVNENRSVNQHGWWG